HTWAAGDEVDILGEKENDVDLADEVEHLARQVIQFNPFRERTVAAVPALDSHRNCDFLKTIGPHDSRFDPAIGKVDGVEVNQLALGAGLRRACRGEIRDSLEQVRFHLGVLAEEDNNAELELLFKLDVVAKIDQAQGGQIHESSIFQKLFTCGRSLPAR